MLGEKEWRDHAELVGSVTLAWNQTVHQLLRVFTHLTGIESPLAEAIFFAPQSDSSQRRLIKRVAEVVGLADKDRAALADILKQIDKVSSGRNLAAHIIFGLTAFDPETGSWGAKVVPALATQDKRLEADFQAQFRDVEQKLYAAHQALSDWVIHTPYPPRDHDGPPLPKAARASISKMLAEHEAQIPVSDSPWTSDATG